ncbi:DNA-cytosine methyltransferase [Stanieria sp. NIES-3757]|nr:DNA-cytosine methyltransferase [Stanieria sp. NIES-3757]
MKIVSLFSGCGGMDLGFIWSGYQVVWANDIDHYACETYKLNIGNHIIEADIAQIDFFSIPDCDVILGGFPCQDFSMIWKRKGIESDRGNLYQYFVKAVALKQPLFFVAENVRGLLTANKGKAIQKIIEDFENCGYKINADIYNFADYGTPQLRERVLIIGIRKDIDFNYQKPQPTHNNYITAGEALRGVEKAIYNNETLKIRPKTTKILELIPEGGNFQSIPKDSPYYVKGMISHVYRRLDRNKPATTIIAAGGGGTWGYHFSEPRPLTNRERARLFGYPDDFKFIGKIADVRRQIGNSVSPVAIKVIADELKPIFNIKSKQNVLHKGLRKRTQTNFHQNGLNQYQQLQLPLVFEKYSVKTEKILELIQEEDMMPSSRVHTASNTIKQQYNLVNTINNEETDLLFINENTYLTPNQALKFFELCKRDIQPKDLEFRRKKNLKIGDETIQPEIVFQRVRGSRNRVCCQLRDLENYILNIYKHSIDLEYNDAKIVIENYDEVLHRSKKHGMRGQRNFTGKIEDEVRGKLAEHGFSKYLANLNNIEFPVDYSKVSDSNTKRDAGDFTQVVINYQMYDIPQQYHISLKSTNGNYLAIPQHEIDWEGEIFVLVKLHIKETFLYQAIKAGLQLAQLNLNENLGWLEIRGFISKNDFKNSYVSKKLPDGTELSYPNYIKAPIQLNQNISQLTDLLETIKKLVL